MLPRQGGLEFDEKIDIALALVEGTLGSRPEQLEPSYSISTTKLDNLLTFLGNQSDHGTVGAMKRDSLILILTNLLSDGASIVSAGKA